MPATHDAPDRDRRMLDRPPAIDAPRLFLVALVPAELRALAAGDTAAVSAMSGLDYPSIFPEDEYARVGMQWHLEELDAHPEDAEWRVRVVVERASGLVVGAVNLKGSPDAGGDVEIGWGIIRARRRLGYASEAAIAVAAWVSRQPHVRSLSATIDDDNSISQRVAVKLGLMRTTQERRNRPLWWRTIP